METDSPSNESLHNEESSEGDYGFWPFKYIGPTGRPLSEPPIFNYDQFIRENRIPSDARLKRLWAKDIETGYKWRDLTTEASLLHQHWTWAYQMMEDETSPERAGFYEGLKVTLWEDFRTMTLGDHDPGKLFSDAIKKGVLTQLGLWEYYHLDEDGGTKAVQTKLDKGENVFWALRNEWGLLYGYCQEAFGKYGQLAPPDLYAEIKKGIDEQYRGDEEEEESKNQEKQSSNVGEAQQPSETKDTETNPDAAATDAFTTDDENEPSPPPPNLEDPLTAATTENSALRKRIAELELANAVLKKQK